MITIINANESSYPIIHSLAHRTWPHAFRNILSPEQIEFMLNWMYSIPSIKEQIEVKGHHFILVKKEETYLGYASYELDYKHTGSAKLHKIYVLPESQGTGAGKALMEEVIKRSKEAKSKSLLLNVNRENSAIGFYEKKGFKIIKTEDIDIGNGYFMNDFVMEMAYH
jgi:diamine N-acetyltransferase